jgi:tRNA A-37 threonylcarbamoyl transferase component Bud32
MAVEPVKSETREQELDALLGSYLEAMDAGKAPSREELLASHPELAADLSLFFSDNDKVRSWTAPVLDTLRPADAEATIEAGAGDRHLETVVPGVKLGIFGDYELLKEIGRGGMSVVYKARQLSLNRLVAIKMIRADRLFTEADSLRFHHEAETVAKLDHPGMVPIYEVGRWDAEGLDAPIMYFSMKLLEGGDLTALCRQAPGGADQKRVARLVASAARALQHAHEQNILHRDLKPSNILLDGDGQAHVTDFGLALCLERDLSLTQTGAIVGTPGYMSPEQAMGRRDLTPATDVYGLGAVLYALLTGRPPFKRESALDTLLYVKETEPEPPSLWNYSLDRTLEAICLKCLAKAPKQRYASAAALAEDLEHWLAGEPTVARPEGWRGKMRRVWRRHRAKAAVALIALLPVTVWLAAAALTRGPSPEELDARKQQQALAEISRDLASGRGVDLVGDSGTPRYYRWVTGMPRQSTFINPDDGTFAIQSDGESLFELAPATMSEGYRLSAQMRHTESRGTFGSIGLYFAHTQFVSKNGTGHEFYYVEFNDLVREHDAKQNRVRLHRADVFEPGMHGIVRGMGSWDCFFTPTGVDAGPTWHELKMEWGKAGLTIQFDARQCYRMSRDETAIYKVLEDDRYEVPDIPFTMQGGLGIYVAKSTVSFKRVRLEPIAE